MLRCHHQYIFLRYFWHYKQIDEPFFKQNDSKKLINNKRYRLWKRNKRKKGAKHSLKEMEIASRLVYFTKLSTNKTWLDIENETLKAFIKQYKNLDLNYKTSNIYTTFLI